jgi:drug/metabolite transporter (DMT)-like permease
LTEPRLHLLLPLASSVIYVFGAVLLKRATAAGVGMWRAAFATNLASAVGFLPLLALGGPGQGWAALWQPAVVALLLVVGQCASLWALTRGDVSVATPVLGDHDRRVRRCHGREHRLWHPRFVERFTGLVGGSLAGIG